MTRAIALKYDGDRGRLGWVVCEGSSQLPGPAQRLTMTVKSQGAVGARKSEKLELRAGSTRVGTGTYHSDRQCLLELRPRAAIGRACTRKVTGTWTAKVGDRKGVDRLNSDS